MAKSKQPNLINRKKKGNKTESSQDNDVIAPKRLDVETKRFPSSIHQSACIIFFVATILYGGTYRAGFYEMDRRKIFMNNNVVGNATFHDLLNNDCHGYELGTSIGSLYQPLAILTFRINYILTESNPIVEHCINILLHGVVSTLVFYLTYSIFGHFYHWYGNPIHVKLIAQLTGVLFATHSIHTETVSEIGGRADLLCALFYIGSLLSYIKALPRVESTSQMMGTSKTAPVFVSRFWLSTCFGCSWLTAICAEYGTTCFLICIAWEVCYSRKHGFRRKSIQHSNSTLRIILLAIGYTIVRFWMWSKFDQSILPHSWDKLDNHIIFETNQLKLWLTILYTHICYLKLLILPIYLVHDRAFNAVPIIQFTGDIRLYEVIIGYPLFLFGMYKIIQSTNESKKYAVMFLFCLTIVPFIPNSQIFYYIQNVICERIMYVPSIGYCMLYSTGAVHIVSTYYGTILHQDVFDMTSLTDCFCAAFGDPKRRQGVKYVRRNWLTFRIMCLSIIVVPLLVLTIKTMHRTNEWKSEISLLEADLKSVPNNTRILNHIAQIWMDSGEQTQAAKARTLLERALEIYPNYGGAYGNYGLCLSMLGDNYNAVVQLRKSLLFNGFSCEVRAYLGDALMQLYLAGRDAPPINHPSEAVPIRRWENGKLIPVDVENAQSSDILDQAQHHLLYAINSGCTFPVTYYYLGVNVYSKGNYRQALQFFADALKAGDGKLSFGRKIHVPTAYNMIGLAHMKSGNIKEAIKAFETGMEYDDKKVLVELLSNCGLAYLKLRYDPEVDLTQQENPKEKALGYFKRALNLRPTNAILMNNVGWALAQLGEHEAALEQYYRARDLLPNHNNILGNIKTSEALLLNQTP